MRLYFAGAFVVLAVLDTAATAAPDPIGQIPEPIATRQTAFLIPFTMPSGQVGTVEPTEVRLLVSEDNGAQWRLDSQAHPKQKTFVFRAPRDGEYWFAIRTVDQSGREWPDGVAAPELRVIVDTLAPRLELTAGRGESGEITARWQSVDPLLDAASLKIDFQVYGNPLWRSVALDTPREITPRSAITGDVRFYAESAGPIVVRAQIADRAGNITTAQARTDGDQRLPPRDNLGSDRGVSAMVRRTDPVPPAGQPQRWPADATATAPLLRNEELPAPPDSGRAPAQVVTPAPGRRRDQFVSSPAETVEPRNRPENTATGDDGEPITGQPDSVPSTDRGPALDGQAAPAEEPAPSAERPRMVNSKSFEWEYDVEAVGPSGVAKVELFGTRDNGKTWTSLGVDADNRSPIKATVEGEGRYGLRLSVASGSGLGGLPPVAGDQPDVWVGVDLTRPKAVLTTTEQGVGERAGELIVRWEASDAGLGSRPVSLLFSPKPGGPWSMVASGLENTGSYAWRLDNRVPDRVYLRLEVRDEAGNVGDFESADAIAIDRQRPQGKLRSVRPLGNSARAPIVNPYVR